MEKSVKNKKKRKFLNNQLTSKSVFLKRKKKVEVEEKPPTQFNIYIFHVTDLLPKKKLLN